MGGLSVGLILNSPCLHHENCPVDKKENFYWHLGNERVRYTHSNQSIRKRNLTFLSIIKCKTTGHKFIHCWRRHDVSTRFYSPLTGAQMEDVRGSWWRRDSSPSGEGGNKFSIFPLSGLFPLLFFHIFLEGQRQIQFYWSYLFSLLLECYLFCQTHKWDQNTKPGMILKLSQ